VNIDYRRKAFGRSAASRKAETWHVDRSAPARSWQASEMFQREVHNRHMASNNRALRTRFRDQSCGCV